MAAAFALRDRAWAEIPFLAECLLARLHPADAAQLEQLQSVIRGADALGQELDDLLTTGQWPEETQAKTVDLKRQLDALREGFLRECTDLEQAGPDKQTLGAIANLLAVPLVPTDQRNGLRGVYLRRLTSPAEGFRIASAEETGAKSATAAAGQTTWQFLDRLTRAKQHPALTILRLATRQGPESGNQSPLEAGSQEDPKPEDYSEVAYRQRWIELAGQGDEVRRLLSGVGPQAETHLAETLAKLASGEKSPAAVRAGRSAADRLVRASAVWLVQSPWARPAADPAHLLRDLDLHYLLLWQARRTLDDFWGPAPGSPTPFFDTAAADYLRSAEALCKNDAGLQDARNLLALGREAAAEAIQPGPLGVLFVDAKETATAQHVPIAEAAHLPAGRAAVYLQDRQGELLPLLSAKTAAAPDLRRIGCAVSPAGGNLALDYWIPNDKRLQDTATLDAIALYRGHVRTRSFDVQPADRGIYALKVETLPAAAKTIHHYSPKTGTVRHTFLYPDATAADVAACQLLLTTSEKLVDGAIALPEPLEVTLTPD